MWKYYAAKRVKGKKWQVLFILNMPERTCLSQATDMMWATGREAETILLESQLAQKNVLPVASDVPTVEYDAQLFYDWKYTQCHVNSREWLAERAAEEGITINPARFA